MRGVGGDLLKFTGITAIDVQVSGSNTLFKVGDGVINNANFGSRTLLLVSRIFRAESKIKNRALLYEGFRKPKSGAQINKDTNTLLLTASATSGFVAADVNVNLLGAIFTFNYPEIRSDRFFNGQLTMDNYQLFTINYSLNGDRYSKSHPKKSGLMDKQKLKLSLV